MFTKAITKAIQIAVGTSRLARAIGVTPQMVSQWARDRNPNPISIITCSLIQQATGVPCEELSPSEDWVTLRAVLRPKDHGTINFVGAAEAA